MAKSFHSYEKRRKELAKKKKREEKLARKRAKGSNAQQNQEIETGQETQPGEEDTSVPAATE